MNTRTHVVIPSNVITEIDGLVGKRGRSRFLTQAASKELTRLRQKTALNEAFGTWKKQDHPELQNGVAAHVRKLRQENEKRFQKQLTSK